MRQFDRFRFLRMGIFAVLCAAGALTAGTNKVLIFGLDGTRPDALLAANAPHLDSLMAHGTVSFDALTVPPTISGPGWSSILTGVWNDKHGIKDNSFTGGRFDIYPCVFKRIKEFDPSLITASIVNMKAINDNIVTDADYTAQSGSDETVAVLAVDYLRSNDPDLMFVQFKEADYAGHAGGFDLVNSEYIAKIEAIDVCIGEVLNAVYGRPNAAVENWLVLAVADHGALGRAHGGASLEERNVFFIGTGGGMPVRNIARKKTDVPAPAKSLQFDGVSNFLSIADLPRFRFGASRDFTVECLVKTSGWSGSPTLISNINRAGGPNHGFTLACIENGKWKANVADGTSEVEIVGGRIDDGRWHHLAASYDRDSLLCMVQDGFRYNHRSIGRIGNADSGSKIGIGQDGSLRYPSFFRGTMAEVRIWDCVVPDSLLADGIGKPVDESHPLFSNLIGYWRMDVDSGRMVVDFSPYNDTLQVQGAEPVWTASLDSVSVYDYRDTPRIVDVSATALAHLAVPVDSLWHLDGRSIGIRPTGGILRDTLRADRALTAAGSPWRVTADVIVPTDVTLTIEPGAVVYFDPSAGIKVESGGRLVAAGTDEARITLTRTPGSSSPWDGIEFDRTMKDNVISHVDMTYGDQQNEMILVQYSKLLIDHATWNNTTKTVIEVEHPQLLVNNSVFPDVDGQEVIHGAALRDDEYLVLQGNTFGRPSGYNDVIDFSDCRRPGPVFEVYDNVFTGGGDDALDLDGCDAHIEGNVFMNFHKANGSSSTSNALATGVFNGYSPTIVAARNVFMNNDHAVLLKEDVFMRADNNVFVNCVHGAINFGEWPERTVDPGKGAVLDGNIFWNNGSAFQNQFAQPGKKDPVIEMNRCVVSKDLHDLGTGNLDVDPKFVNPGNDFHLLSDSQVRDMGPNGLDMGAFVPAGASISGEPDSVTDRTDATLRVGGPGITQYKYGVNGADGPWYGDYSLPGDSTIHVTGLNGQSVTVYVMGRNSAGRWQKNPDHTQSRRWKINLIASGTSESRNAPKLFALHQNAPNPFNPLTMIAFELPRSADVRLEVLDALGRRIVELASGRYVAGKYRTVWDGREFPSGTYFGRLQAGNFIKTIKMSLVK